jgi:AraC-like DNA-binding protein
MSGMDRDGPVTRAAFSTTDAEAAEEFLRGLYNDNRLELHGRPEDFTLDHILVATPGFAINRLSTGIDLLMDGRPLPDDLLVVARPLSGGYALRDSDFPDTDVAEREVVLAPPAGAMTAVCVPMDLAVITLGRHEVASYASAVTGIEPADLAFHTITPQSPTMARFWTETVSHVQSFVLDAPWAAGLPSLLDQALHSLTAALLSTFPNTALDRATDPEAPPVRGAVSPRQLREAVDYLDHHASGPVGPIDLFEHTGLPVSEIVESLRRRDGRHPAELLWLARLRGVRRDLLEAAPDGGRAVAELAARWGFANVDRFRVAYERRFGETPDATLRR